jgi:hypothetical protein
MGHPLFPNETRKGIVYEGIERIRVGRWAEGTCSYARRVFGADEMRTEDDIFVLFGGGYYELLAMNAEEDDIIVRRKIMLRGKSLPLNAEDDEEPNPHESMQLIKKTEGEPSITQLIMSMNQQMIGFFSTMMRTSKEESRALIEGSKLDARAMAEMAAKSSEMQLRVMSDFFAKTMELAKSTPAPNAGGSSDGTFSPEQLLELGSALADARNDGMSETVGKITEAFRFAVEAKQKQRTESPPPNGAPPPAPTAPPDGHGPVA